MGPLWASKFTPSFWQSFSWRLVGFCKQMFAFHDDYYYEYYHYHKYYE